MKQAEIGTVKSLAAPLKLKPGRKRMGRASLRPVQGVGLVRIQNLPESVVTVHTILTGTVIVISSQPPGKDGHVRLTTVPIKALSNEVRVRYQC